MIWTELNERQRQDIIRRHGNGESVDTLASEYDLLSSSLSRKLRLLRNGPRELYYRRAMTDLFMDGGSCRVFVYSDCHFGMHDEAALDIALQIAREFNPDVVINLGDTLDCHVLSRYRHDPGAPSIQDERDAWYVFAESLNAVTPDADGDRYILAGNHDIRFKNSVADWNLTDMEEMTLDGLLYTKELGYHPICDVIAVNRKGTLAYPNAMMYMFHGDSARAHAGATARHYSDMFSTGSTITGHAHRSAMYTRRTANGVVESFEVGTLARIDPEYTMFPNWTQSVLTGDFVGDSFSFQNTVIRNGYAIFYGEEYYSSLMERNVEP